MESQVRGGTRWRRFAVVMVPCVASTVVLGVALAQGALAASFSVSGQNFKVTAKQLVGKDFVQYGGVAEGPGGVKHPVAVSAFSTATITAMCQSVVTPVPFIGDVTLVLKAGGGEDQVQAQDLYLDVESLDADAEFEDIDIGIAAGSNPRYKKGPADSETARFGFAQQAKKATLNDVHQTAWATTAGKFTLPDLALSLNVGNRRDYECY